MYRRIIRLALFFVRLLSQRQLEELKKLLTTIASKPKPPLYESPTISAILGGIAATILAGLFSWIGSLSTRRKEKAELSYLLIKEWDSFKEQRIEAYDIFVRPYEAAIEDAIKSKSPETLTSLLPAFSSSLEREGGKEQMLKLSLLLEFFDRVDLLKNKNFVNKELLQEYLCSDYNTWYTKYFQFQRNSNIEKDEDYRKGFKDSHDWLLTKPRRWWKLWQ